MRGLAIWITVMFAAVTASAISVSEYQAGMKVTPLQGDTKVSKTGSKNVRANAPRNTSKTVVQSLKWKCEVRYRGKTRPAKSEVRAFYIGYEANDMNAKILGKEVKEVELDDAGKADIELESPSVTMTKSKTTSGGGRGKSQKTKSTVTGQRMAGCVVQLWEDGRLVKAYASTSQWDKAAKNEEFCEELLNSRNARLGSGKSRE